MKVTVKDLVKDILLEDKEGEEAKAKEKEKAAKPSKPGIEASTGSGRFAAGVSEAGALAKENPKQLMKNLKIANAMGNNDIDKIKNILKQAFTGADAMKKVYTTLMTITKGNKQGLKVKVSEIKARDGVKYLYHTLIGAQNSGIFEPSSLIQIENSSGSIIIYQGKKRSWE